MHHFDYRQGTLHAEDVSVTRIAAEVGTPVYIYSTATLTRHYQLFAKAVGAPKHRVFYAMKANSNQAIVKTLGQLGAGADTVSEGEIRRALAAGITADRIVFSGVGKSAQELAFAVDAGIYQVNIETESELELLSKVASARGRRQNAVVNPSGTCGPGFAPSVLERRRSAGRKLSTFFGWFVPKEPGPVVEVCRPPRSAGPDSPVGIAVDCSTLSSWAAGSASWGH